MRLREVQKVIADNLPNLLNIEGEDFSRSGTSYKRVHAYDMIRASTINLLNTGLFEPEKEIFESKELLSLVNSNTMTFDKNSYIEFIRVINRVAYKSEAMETLISSSLHSELENDSSLIINLPSRELSIIEFNEIINILENVFKLLHGSIKDFQSEVIIENFDVGSEWIILSLLSNSAVKLFGSLVTIVQRAQVGNRQIKALDRQLESLDLTEDTKQRVIEAQVEFNLALYGKLADEYLDTNDLENQAEIHSRMTKVLENIDKLLSKGVGFEAAISASNEVAKTFPPIQEQKLLDQAKILDTLKHLPVKGSDQATD